MPSSDRSFTDTALLGAAATIGLAASLMAHALVPTPAVRPADRVAVVVLGYPARRNSRPHPIQRWRARLAVDTAVAHAASLVVFTGGQGRRLVAESVVMADIARGLGLVETTIVTETSSTNTWENVADAAPRVADADRVLIVSDPLHAARARRYWLVQRAGDEARVFVTDRCGFWDGWWLKPAAALDALAPAARARLRLI